MARHRAINTRRRAVALLGIAFTLCVAVISTGTQPGVSKALLTGNATQPTNTFTTTTVGTPTSPTVTRSGTSLVLNWGASNAVASGYRIERSDTAAGPWTNIATVNGYTNVSYTDAAPLPGANYYRVLAYRATNWVSPTTTAAGGSVPLPVPAGITWSGTQTAPTQVTFSWNSLPGAKDYLLWVNACNPNTGACRALNFTVTGTSYVLDESTAGIRYDFTVKGRDALNTAGAESSPVSARNVPAITTVTFAPDMAEKYLYYFMNPLVTAGWSTAMTMEVQVQVNGGTWGSTAAMNFQSESNTWRKLLAYGAPGQDYRFRIRGCNDSGCSAWSAASGVQRIPYWSSVSNDVFYPGGTASQKFAIFYRMHPNPGTTTDQYQFVNINGTVGYDVGYDCPAFRNCTTTDDRAIFLSGATHLFRSFNIQANQGGSGARTWEFFHKTYAAASYDNQGMMYHANANAPATRAGDWALWAWGPAGDLHFGDGSVKIVGSKMGDGAWHLYHVTYNGAGTVAVYEDGILLKSFPYTVNTKAGTNAYLGALMIGDPMNPAKYPGPGWYDEWAIYDYALTPTQITNRWAARADGT